MIPELKPIIVKKFNAKSIAQVELIQELWSNYGQILRVKLVGGDHDSVIVKNINTSKLSNHPRGWHTSVSHDRKVKSYEVETNWYNNWSDKCGEECRVAKCYLIRDTLEGKVIMLEDLNQSGFEDRKSYLNIDEVKLCLSWLANFHAIFLDDEPKGLWQIGTYWHLATRPEELDQMKDGELKEAAEQIDELLNGCQYKTIVHGDAKVANFCFDLVNTKVAVVDFQYVGGGCGMKDVVYFFSSCLTEDECELYEEELLDYYFSELEIALSKCCKQINFSELEKEWRGIYAVGWADFTRFLLGWAPNHQKLNNYTQKQVEKTLKIIG